MIVVPIEVYRTIPMDGGKMTEGAEMIGLMRQLYPICRSITGDGVRQTLRELQQWIALTVEEVPTGTEVFDWTVPREWNIRDGFIKDAHGERIVDFHRSNLHVLNYSIPFHGTLSFEALKSHLFTLPDHPDWIPYRTSYYAENWGFCLSQNQFNQLAARPDDSYEVCIDSTLDLGGLTYGEYVLPGTTNDEVLISCHVCHPSLCNDNLSGIAVAVMLARALAGDQRRYTYRFLFIPGTIGSITWLARNEDRINKIKHGLVLTCIGDPAPITYKKTRKGDATIDRAAAHVLNHLNKPFNLLEFYPYGYDERQYNSPGINLSVGAIMRSQHGTFPQYHTSADNFELVTADALEDSLKTILQILSLLEANRYYVNLKPKGEPQLGKRGIYKTISGQSTVSFDQMALFWVLSFSDGQHTLLDIAERSGLPFAQIKIAADILQRHELLRESDQR
jgi:aminopeptidase-like protein